MRKGCIHAKAKEGPHVCLYRDRCLHLISSSGRYTHINGKAHRRVPFGCYKIGLIASGEEHKFLTNELKMTLVFTIISGQKSLGLYHLPDTSSELKADKRSESGAFLQTYNTTPEDAMLDGISSNVAMAVKEYILSKQLQESEENTTDCSKARMTP